VADQGKWFKLWYTALHDADLENLPDKEWRCWVSLGTYMKAHGCDGTVTFVSPGTALTKLFNVPTFGAAIAILRRFPHCTVEEVKSIVSPETIASVTLKITYHNWLKYQGDFSTERVREFRKKKRPNETLQEEKRGEETKSPSPLSSSPKRTGRSAPPDAPAPRPSATLVNDERPEKSHDDFLALGHRDTDPPRTDFDWSHLEQSMTNVERVQSKMREKLYRERNGNGALRTTAPAYVPEDDQF